MNETRRKIEKALPAGWALRNNFDIQDGNQYGNKWAVLNEYRRVVFVGKTLDRIREKLEGIDSEIEDYIVY